MNEADTTTRSRRQWVAAAKARVCKGEPGSAVETEFVKQGLDPQTAKLIIEEAIRNARSRATKLLIGSVSLAALGLFVTVVSYLEATTSPYGNTYWIWYGPILVGGIISLVALARLMRIRH